MPAWNPDIAEFIRSVSYSVIFYSSKLVPRIATSTKGVSFLQ